MDVLETRSLSLSNSFESMYIKSKHERAASECTKDTGVGAKGKTTCRALVNRSLPYNVQILAKPYRKTSWSSHRILSPSDLLLRIPAFTYFFYRASAIALKQGLYDASVVVLPACILCQYPLAIILRAHSHVGRH